MSGIKICALCIFVNKTDDAFECRRYPPKINIRDESIYPLVAGEDWCGEFRKGKAVALPERREYIVVEED